MSFFKIDILLVDLGYIKKSFMFSKIMMQHGDSINFIENSELLFDVRGSYGFIPLQNDIDLYGTVHMGSITFALGYAYIFDKKTKSDAPKS